VHDVQIPGKQLILFIESINLIFSLKSAAEKPDGTDRAITAFGAGLDLGQAATVLAGMEKPPQVFGLVSGVLDIYMNVKEMNKSFNEGDLDSATGSFVVASGATVGAAGTFIELFLVAGEVPLVGTVLAVAGLVLMAIGFLKKLASKSPLEKFVSHSSWGEDYGAAGNPDWSPAPYEQWKGAKEFDYQIRALLNLVCDFEIAKPDRYDKLRFKLSWHPKKISKLRVRYREKKSGGSDRVVVETEVAFTDKGPVSSNTNLRPLMVDDRTLELEVVGGVAPWRPRPRDDGQPTTPAAKRFGLTDVPDPYPDLDSAGVAAMFSITFGGQTPVHVPHAAREDGSGWKEIRLK
jgi:hypothetical protein